MKTRAAVWASDFAQDWKALSEIASPTPASQASVSVIQLSIAEVKRDRPLDMGSPHESVQGRSSGPHRPASALRIAAINAGRSSGLRLVMTFPSTQTC